MKSVLRTSEIGELRIETKYQSTIGNIGSAELRKRRQTMKPLQKIKEASTTTGLSQWYLRNGVRDGTIPHIRAGKTILINVPALLKRLGVEVGESD